MSSDKIAKLARMANQIGDAFAADPAGAVGAASHLRQFWTPKMIRELADAAAKGEAGLNATARAALAAATDPPR